MLEKVVINGEHALNVVTRLECRKESKKMPKFTFTITSENEKWLRAQNRKKGDMSQILNALMKEKQRGK